MSLHHNFIWFIAFSSLLDLSIQLGAYEIILDRLETAHGDDDKIFSFDTLRIKKFNRTTFVMNGKYTVKQELDDDMAITFAALNLQGGQYKKIFEKDFDHFCSAMYLDAFQSPFEGYQAHNKNPVPWKTCPFPAGSNEVFNYLAMDTESLLPPYIPGGEKWKVEMRFLRNGTDLGGYNIYMVLRNEQSLLGN